MKFWETLLPMEIALKTKPRVNLMSPLLRAARASRPFSGPGGLRGADRRLKPVRLHAIDVWVPVGQL